MAKTAAQLGIKAPAGGFKEGGWYNGYNYDAASGTFGEVNQIWSKKLPQSGSFVGAEVRAQSAAAQGVSPQQFDAFLSKQGATPTQLPQAPATTHQLQSTLNDFSSNAFEAASSVSTPGVQTLEEIAKGIKDSGLLPSGEAPEAPSLVDTFTELSDAKGVDAIQASINNLKAQQDEIAAQLRTNVAGERGKPVATNVIAGRISEQERIAREDYDFVSRQLTRKQDELNTALGSIKLIMDLTQQDYSNASQAYATKFTQAMSVINLVQGIQQDQKTDVQRATDNARANLQIMVNSIKEGNMDLASLPADQQAQLNKLEVQAGLPVGFMQSIRVDPKANIISTSTSNGITQVLVKNADGTISVQSYGTATDGGAGSKNSALKADVAAKMTLDQVMKKYGNTMSPDTILEVYNSNSPFGKAKESADTLAKKYNVSTQTTSQSNLSTNLQEAKAAIDQGADSGAVKRRFLEQHPTSGAAFDSYINAY